MASTSEYLEYVLDLLTGVPEVSSRKSNHSLPLNTGYAESALLLSARR